MRDYARESIAAWEETYGNHFKWAILIAIVLHIGLLYTLKDSGQQEIVWEIPKVKPPIVIHNLPDVLRPTPPPKQTPVRRQTETSRSLRSQVRPPPAKIPVPVPANTIIETSEIVMTIDEWDIEFPEPEPAVNIPYSLKHPAIVAPVCTTRVPPVYPRVVERLGLRGVTKLRCVINPDGYPEQIEVLESFNSVCDEAALNAVKQWKYTPATLNDVPVSVFMDLIISFVPKR